MTTELSYVQVETGVRAPILNPLVKADADALAAAFRDARPFPHVVMPDFFEQSVAEALLRDFPPFDEHFAPGEMRRGGKKATRRDVRSLSDAYRELDDYLQTPEFLQLMSDISGIPNLLYDAEYHGGGTHDNLDGASLYTHVDFNYHPKGWHRRLNLIVYLSPEWEFEWGGHLELHSDPWEPERDTAELVPTRFNQAVLFETSERSWHGFRHVTLPPGCEDISRKSFAIYLYTTDRPAEQTAPRHSTLYVPFGMPADLRPGDTLTAAQHELLERRFAEFRGMLRFQYDRQRNLSDEFAAGYRLDLQGYAVQTRAPRGRWTDGWVSSDFSMAFTATRAVTGLRLEIDSPNLADRQVLEVDANGWHGVESFEPGQTRVIDVPLVCAAGAATEVVIRARRTWSPGGADNRQLAYRIVSAVLEH